MISLIIFFSFLGSYALYQSSDRALLYQDLAVQIRLQEKKSISKSLGVIGILCSMVLTCVQYGILTGFIIWTMIAMSVLGLLIVIAPLKIFNYKHLIAIMILITIVEFNF